MTPLHGYDIHVTMRGYMNTFSKTLIYQDKSLIIKDNFIFFEWDDLAFHRRTQSARLYNNSQTLTDRYEACNGIFL